MLVVACMSLSFCHLRCDRACFTADRDQPGGEGRGGEGRALMYYLKVVATVINYNVTPGANYSWPIHKGCFCCMQLVLKA